MSKYHKMEFKINSSPLLKMSDITKRLFNRNFHSDVQFSVEGKVIYAHSLELMKRSEVFEQELEATFGENKLIPIGDCSYENFCEFIRFIYTDECEITDSNRIEILKLASHYKVIMLENLLINFRSSAKSQLQLFEHSVVNKYELLRNTMEHYIVKELKQYFKGNALFALRHQESIETLLSFQPFPKEIRSSEIFTALDKWTEWYSRSHRLSLEERQQQFNYLSSKIKFLNYAEIKECVEKFPQISSRSDIQKISIVYCLPNPYRYQYQERYTIEELYETELIVFKDTILYGIRIGFDNREGPIEIEVSGIPHEKFEITPNYSGNQDDLTIIIGSSLHLKSNCDYTIKIKYFIDPNKRNYVMCRTCGVKAIINDAANSVAVTQISANMFEMFFKSPEDEKKSI